MGAAEVIAFEEVRARPPWDALRGQLHTRFDQWLDGLEAQLQEPAPTLAQVTETVWNRRQELTGGLPETIVAHAHRGESTRQQTRCPQGDRVLQARAPVSRTVETMVGAVQIERPYFSCRPCRCGVYPLEAALGLAPGRTQLDGQKAAVKLVTEVPYDEAQTLFGDLTGVGLGSERRHTVTNHIAEGLTVLDVVPPRNESEQRLAAVSAGRSRRPGLVLGIAGASGLHGRTVPGSHGQGTGASAPSALGGGGSGVMPRAFVSLSLMASALSMGSVGIRYQTRSNLARPSSRSKRPG
jgi:hypothetical protein